MIDRARRAQVRYYHLTLRPAAGMGLSPSVAHQDRPVLGSHNPVTLGR
jgi:hypothetical protein